MSSVTGNTLLQALFVAHQLIELASLDNSNIDIATFHNLAGRTVSGSMIMSTGLQSKKNATFDAMRIVKELFKASFSFKDKSEIKKDCFEYCFVSKKENKKIYYWINWSEYSVNIDMNLTGSISEYYGNNLFDKSSEKTKFNYSTTECSDCNIKLEPYSITLFEQSGN